jgi:transcriptional/translational regulatory protein YebC/TACO1
MVDCLTGDRERVAAAVRRAFLRHGGHPGASGAVAYLFKEVGRLAYVRAARLGSQLDLAWEAGAEEVVLGRDGSIEVLTDPVELDAVRSKLAHAGCEAAASGVTFRSSVKVELSGSEALEMAGLLAALEGLDDVRSIYTNAEVAGELLAGV